MRNIATLSAGLAMALLLGRGEAFGQVGGAGQSEPPSAQPADPEGVPPQADGAGEPFSDEDIGRILENLSPQQLQQLIETAARQRLQYERQQVEAELRQGLLYDPDDVDAAVAALNLDPLDTQKDNIERIFRAFAKVDAKFARAWKLLGEGKFDKAAEALRTALDSQQATYLGAARYYAYAKALAGCNRPYDSADAFRELLENMPDRVSFAAGAACEAAAIYEGLKRYIYAMEMHARCLKDYGLTMDKDQAEKTLQRLKELQHLYKDPLGSLTERMGDVEARLAKGDSAKQTQDKQDEIVALLEDIIRTAEENQPGGGGGGQVRGRGKRKGQQQSQQQGQGQGQGSGNSPPQGSGQPSSPAQVSALVGGQPARPTKLSEVHKATELDDWSALPPRERERLHEIARKAMSERYRDIVSDYHSSMARHRNE